MKKYTKILYGLNFIFEHFYSTFVKNITRVVLNNKYNR